MDNYLRRVCSCHVALRRFGMLGMSFARQRRVEAVVCREVDEYLSICVCRFAVNCGLYSTVISYEMTSNDNIVSSSSIVGSVILCTGSVCQIIK